MKYMTIHIIKFPIFHCYLLPFDSNYCFNVRKVKRFSSSLEGKLKYFPFHTLFSIVKIDKEKYKLYSQYEEYKK